MERHPQIEIPENQLCSEERGPTAGYKTDAAHLQKKERKSLRGVCLTCLLGLTFAVLSAAEEYTINWRPVIHILAAKILQ